MYAEDSFFTLNWIGRTGVLCISLTLTALLFYVAWRWMAGKAWYWRVLIALVLFYLFEWLAPQVYYTFYIWYFETLPWQIVVHNPPSPATLGKILTFSDWANLSHHSQALLGWGLILLAIYRPRIEQYFGDRLLTYPLSDMLRMSVSPPDFGGELAPNLPRTPTLSRSGSGTAAQRRGEGSRPSITPVHQAIPHTKRPAHNWQFEHPRCRRGWLE